MKHDIRQNVSNRTQMKSLSRRTVNIDDTPGLRTSLKKQNNQLSRPAAVLLAVVAVLMIQPHISFGKNTDVLTFGDKASESAHDLAAETSKIVEGKDGRMARRVMKVDQKHPIGSISFTMECHPSERTYLTLKWQTYEELWSELMLFHGDEAVGYLRSSAWPTANYPPGWNNEKHSEWWYTTIRLPMSITEGKGKVDLRLVDWGKTPRATKVLKLQTENANCVF